MKTHAAQSLFRIHGIASIPALRKSPRHRLRTALAALCRAVVEPCRARRDHARLLGMTERELRDVGLHRIESAATVHIVPLDAGA
jgi:uncharacterized protein YjiS (DUF1127 family)